MKEYELRICWMYHDIMDLYGDKGNIMVLKKRCADRGIRCVVDTCGIGEEKDLTNYHLLFIGGGADKEQALLIDDLYKRKDAIQKAMQKGVFIFLVCGGYQLFGQYYISADGSKIPGLQFFDYYTEAPQNYQRCIGNVAIRCNLDGHEMTLVGFENHGGQTYGVTHPLGKVLHGKGNNMQDQVEGFYNGQVLGTYLHGPLFPKNPEIADFVIVKSLQKEFPDLQLQDLIVLDDTLEKQAKHVMLKRMQIL